METITYLSQNEMRTEDLISLARESGFLNVKVGSDWVLVNLPDGGFCTFERSVVNSNDLEYQSLEDAEREYLQLSDLKPGFASNTMWCHFRTLSRCCRQLLNKFDGWLFLKEFSAQNGFGRDKFPEFETAYGEYLK